MRVLAKKDSEGRLGVCVNGNANGNCHAGRRCVSCLFFFSPVVGARVCVCECVMDWPYVMAASQKANITEARGKWDVVLVSMVLCSSTSRVLREVREKEIGSVWDTSSCTSLMIETRRVTGRSFHL